MQERLQNIVLHFPTETGEESNPFPVSLRLLPMVLVAKPLEVQYVKCLDVVTRTSQLCYLDGDTMVKLHLRSFRQFLILWNGTKSTRTERERPLANAQRLTHCGPISVCTVRVPATTVARQATTPPTGTSWRAFLPLSFTPVGPSALPQNERPECGLCRVQVRVTE